MSESEVISVIIADDEPLAREAICIYLQEDRRFNLLKECSDGKEALKAITSLKPNLALLDIEMPELSGLEVVKKLKEPYPYLVFITAFERYAVNAFEENAVDYVLKPLNKERFFKMLDRVYQNWQLKQGHWDDERNSILERLLSEKRSKYLNKITSKHKGRTRFIPVDTILWVESQGAFCKVHLETKTEITNLSVKQLEEVLDPTQFVRVHKSYIVNVHYIESMESYFHGEYILHLTNETQVKLSRGFKQNLERIINQYK